MKDEDYGKVREKPTNAFEKYVDSCMLIQSGLFFSMPKRKGFDGIDEVALETYQDELVVRAVISKKLAENICELINFEQVKNDYTNKMRTLGVEDLSYEQFCKKREDYNKRLRTYAKLYYMIENDLSGIYLNNDVDISAVLICIYSKIIEIKRNIKADIHLPYITRTKLYRYIYQANLEESDFDIKKISKKSLLGLIELLFTMVVSYKYELDNATDELMVRVDDAHQLFTLYRIEENNDFKSYKEEKEKEVYNWLVDKMHTLQDGSYF